MSLVSGECPPSGIIPDRHPSLSPDKTSPRSTETVIFTTVKNNDFVREKFPQISLACRLGASAPQ